MDGWGSWLGSVALPRSSSIPRSLIAALVAYSFTSQFLPIEPYIVPYLTTTKNFTNCQVTVDIFPISVYSQLIFTLLMVPACFYLSHKVMIALGAVGVLITYLIAWFGQSLLVMQIMENSWTTTVSLLSFMVASELSQILALQGTPYEISLVISLTALVICCAMTCLFPKEKSFSSLSSLTTFWAQNEGWHSILKETWHGRSLRILSLWWAIAFAGFSLVQNYGTSLFDAVDPKSKFNGHILAASQAAGSIGSYCAVYIEDFTSKSGLTIYLFGSVVMGILCICMGISGKIWAAYLSYVTISGIYQILACLVSVRCSRLLSNGQFIILFAINNFAGLLLETLLQAAIEISGMSIFAQFRTFAGFFLLTTAIFLMFSFAGDGRSDTYMLSESEQDIISENI